MKLFIRLFFITVIAISVVSLSSCSKRSYPGHASNKKYHNTVTANAATPKKAPLRKKYIVPNKRRRVLGTDYH
jgi:hypothetical protein